MASQQYGGQQLCCSVVRCKTNRDVGIEKVEEKVEGSNRES